MLCKLHTSSCHATGATIGPCADCPGRKRWPTKTIRRDPVVLCQRRPIRKSKPDAADAGTVKST